MLVTSSFLTYYSTSLSRSPDKPTLIPTSAKLAGILAAILRRVGKLSAAMNAIWIVLACVFQFSSFFDRCYCNSSVLGRGSSRAYSILNLVVDSDILISTRSAWIGGEFSTPSILIL
jgi:hypothetical protein